MITSNSLQLKLSAVFLLVFLSFAQVGCYVSVKSNSDSPSTENPSSPTTTLPQGAFGTQGVVRTKVLASGAQTDDTAFATVQQTDGKILAAGQTWGRGDGDFVVFRYNTDGSLDSSFGSGGQVFTDIGTLSTDKAAAIALQSDGKIVVAGESDTRGWDFALVRYNADGSLDTSFGSAGKVTTDFGTNTYDRGLAVAIQSDGKILVAGESSWIGFPVVRYNSNGTLDTSFGTGGIATTGAAMNAIVRSIAIQSDGKILVAGGQGQFSVVRYNTDGTVDTSFGTGGTVFTNVGGGSSAFAVKVQSDGKILVAGEVQVSITDHDFALVRYNSDGTLDSSFGSGGQVITAVGASSSSWTEPHGMTLQSDGKILVAGATDWDIAVLRYNTDGTLDSSFGSSGKVITDVQSGSSDIGHAIVLQSDSKILVAGEAIVSGARDFALVRYNADGSLETSFGTGGKVHTDLGSGSWDSVGAMVTQTDGKILVAGSTNSSGGDFALTRYNADGSLDTSFGSGGKVITDFNSGVESGATAMVLQNDGKILVAGHAWISSAYQFALVRYNTDGSLDTSFGTGGITTTSVSTGWLSWATAMALQTDGKILVAGYGSNGANGEDFIVVRYNANGSLDPSFGSGGKVFTHLGGDFDEASAIQIQGDGKILVAGTTTPTGYSNTYDFTLVRYNSDGSLDTSFGSSGVVITDVSGDYDQANAMALQSDGKILMAGQANGGFGLVRFNSNGSLDTSFGSGGKVTVQTGTDYNAANALAIQSDGKILIGGYAESTGDDASFALLRFNSNGTADSGFNSNGIVTTNLGAGTEARIRALAVQPDGRILAAGDVEVNPVAASDFVVVRYNSDGSR